MPVIEKRNDSYTPPRIHGWQAVIVKLHPQGQDHVVAVFPHATEAHKYAAGVTGVLSVAVQEVRFLEGEG